MRKGLSPFHAIQVSFLFYLFYHFIYYYFILFTLSRPSDLGSRVRGRPLISVGHWLCLSLAQHLASYAEQWGLRVHPTGPWRLLLKSVLLQRSHLCCLLVGYSMRWGCWRCSVNLGSRRPPRPPGSRKGNHQPCWEKLPEMGLGG